MDNVLNRDALVEFAFVLRHPSWQIDDGMTPASKMAIVRKVNRVQALKMMDSAEVFAVKDGNYYKVDQATVSDAVDKIIAGEAPAGEPEKGILKAISCNISAAGPEVDAYGKQVKKICKVEFFDEVIGELYYVTGYTGFNGTNVEEQEGYYLAFNYTDDFYGNVRMAVIGGSGKEVAVDAGINVVRLGKTKEEVVGKTLVITGEYATDDEKNDIHTVTAVYDMKKLKLVEAAPADPAIKPGEPVDPKPPVDPEPEPEPEPTPEHPVEVEAAPDGKYHYVFLNGNEAVIDAGTDGNTVIKVAGLNDTIIPSTMSAKVFCGGKAGTHYTTGKVTMNGGNVYALNGGGLGDNAAGSKSADVDNAEIVMNNGTVVNITGGGSLRSVVKTAKVTVNGGNVTAVMGGGFEYINKDYNLNAVAGRNPETSPCIVENAIVNVAGGNIKSSVFGGGQGYANTKKAVVTITGGEFGSGFYLVAGGSNGYTKHSVVNYNAPSSSAENVTGVNRGWMENVEINVIAGHIQKLFPVSDEADKSTASMEHHGCEGTSTLKLTGGNVDALNAGVNYQTPITADDPKIKITVGAGCTVTNIEEAKTAFGTSLTVA